MADILRNEGSLIMEDEIKYEAVTIDNLDQVAIAAAQWGMDRSVGWLKRILFDPTVDDLTQDTVRGHMAIQQGTRKLVAVQCYYYQPVFFKKQKMLAESGCIMGADSKFAAEIFCVLEENKKSMMKTNIFITNDLANIESFSIHRFYHSAQPPFGGANTYLFAAADVRAYISLVLNHALKRDGRIALALKQVIMGIGNVVSRPLQWVINGGRIAISRLRGFKIERAMSFDSDGYKSFWARFLDSNSGLVSSREPTRMKWLFDESLKAENIYLYFAIREGSVEGYVLVRRMPQLNGELFEVMDICAVGNNVSCLKSLSCRVKREVSKLGGSRLNLYCYMDNVKDWFSGYTRKLDQECSLCRIDLPEIFNSLKCGEGWFFGPLDGERCMGYGGYIDL